MDKLMKKDRKKISGLSLLEALVSTAIIGIGFVAILQMTTYSVHSINTSGDRTKANYLTNMIFKLRYHYVLYIVPIYSCYLYIILNIQL